MLHILSIWWTYLQTPWLFDLINGQWSGSQNGVICWSDLDLRAPAWCIPHPLKRMNLYANFFLIPQSVPDLLSRHKFYKSKIVFLTIERWSCQRHTLSKVYHIKVTQNCLVCWITRLSITCHVFLLEFYQNVRVRSFKRT